jgi:hypothetical protein
MVKPFFVRLSVVLLIFFVIYGKNTVAGNDTVDNSRKIIEKRQNHEVLKTIQGIIFYLYDRQIIDRNGKRNCFYDAAQKGDGALNRDEFNFVFLPSIYLKARPGITIKNFEGEWGNSVHFLYNRMGFKGKVR